MTPRPDFQAHEACEPTHYTVRELLVCRRELRDILIAPFSESKCKGIGYNISPSELCYSVKKKYLLQVHRTDQETYEFDSNIAATRYGKAGHQKFLVDEIYERTLKMERERRYCIRYLRPYCPLERIKVQITITNANDEFLSYPITYTLEESGYPSTPFATIRDVDCNIKTGTELLDELRKEGMLNE